jgi:hypothetical protein
MLLERGMVIVDACGVMLAESSRLRVDVRLERGRVYGRDGS